VVYRHGRRRIGRPFGGLRSGREVRTAAVLALLGLDGMRLFTTGDRVEALALQAVGEEASNLIRQRDKALAAEIANAVAKLFK
jgi:hypothetical protein